VMADLRKEDEALSNNLAEPVDVDADADARILAGDEATEQALADKAKGERKAEPLLPKLSAADFRAYNSMAEHMDYFVSFPVCFGGLVVGRRGSRR
jgi:hypothetical protein